MFIPVFTRKNTKKTPKSLSNKVATKKETESVTVLAPRYSPLQETNMFVVPTFERYLFQLRCHRRRREVQTLC